MGGDISGVADQKPYEIRCDTDVYITMRDGVRIAAVIYRPAAQGRFPVLFAVSPYQFEYDRLPACAMFPWRETGPIEWYVQQGYAYVHADVRGSGRSEGVFGYFDRTEQQDYYELIEWIARQSWSNGSVGGIGQSYYAVAQWWMGVLNPPALKCIAPYDGAIDLYRDQVYHGGIYSEFRAAWFNMVRANNLLRPANAPIGKDMGVDLVGQILAHQTYDAWWKERSPFERLGEIKVPVFSIGLWGKVGLHLRGNLLGYEQTKSQKKLLVMGARDVQEAAHLFDQIEFHERELLPFYDHFLKGTPNGAMDGPPVRLFIRGHDKYRNDQDWPPRQAEFVAYYLHAERSGSVRSLNDGSLFTDLPTATSSSTNYGYPDPLWQVGVVAMGEFGPDFVGRILTFTSAPVEHDLEVTGPIVLELFAASDQTDTDFFVKVADQHPAAAETTSERPPTFTNVTKGWLKASHREKDAKRSSPHRPFYTHQSPQPIEPGTIYRFDIEVHPTCYVFRKDHRIRLEISNGDSRLTDSYFTHLYLPYKMGTDTIYHDANHPSRLLLPVLSAATSKE